MKGNKDKTFRGCEIEIWMTICLALNSLCHHLRLRILKNHIQLCCESFCEHQTYAKNRMIASKSEDLEQPRTSSYVHSANLKRVNYSKMNMKSQDTA